MKERETISTLEELGNEILAGAQGRIAYNPGENSIIATYQNNDGIYSTRFESPFIVEVNTRAITLTDERGNSPRDTDDKTGSYKDITDQLGVPVSNPFGDLKLETPYRVSLETPEGEDNPQYDDRHLSIGLENATLTLVPCAR